MKKIIVFLLLAISVFSMEEFSSNDGKLTLRFDERSWDKKTIAGSQRLIPKGAYKYAAIYIVDYKNTPVQGKEVLEELKKYLKETKKPLGEIISKTEKDLTWVFYETAKEDKKQGVIELIIGDFFGYYRVVFEGEEESYTKFQSEAKEILGTATYKK